MNSTEPANISPEMIGASHQGRPWLVTSTPKPMPRANSPQPDHPRVAGRVGEVAAPNRGILGGGHEATVRKSLRNVLADPCRSEPVSAIVGGWMILIAQSSTC